MSDEPERRALTGSTAPTAVLIATTLTRRVAVSPGARLPMVTSIRPAVTAVARGLASARPLGMLTTSRTFRAVPVPRLRMRYVTVDRSRGRSTGWLEVAMMLSRGFPPMRTLRDGDDCEALPAGSAEVARIVQRPGESTGRRHEVALPTTKAQVMTFPPFVAVTVMVSPSVPPVTVMDGRAPLGRSGTTLSPGSRRHPRLIHR